MLQHSNFPKDSVGNAQCSFLRGCGNTCPAVQALTLSRGKAQEIVLRQHQASRILRFSRPAQDLKQLAKQWCFNGTHKGRSATEQLWAACHDSATAGACLLAGQHHHQSATETGSTCSGNTVDEKLLAVLSRVKAVWVWLLACLVAHSTTAADCASGWPCVASCKGRCPVLHQGGCFRMASKTLKMTDCFL